MKMSFQATHRRDPLRALACLEVLALVLAVGLDAGLLVAVIAPYQFLLDPRPLVLKMLATVIGAAAIFSMPHAPHRRYINVAIAFISILVMAYLPPYGITVLVLAAILASRLSFSYGLLGAGAVWLNLIAALALQTVAQLRGIPDPSALPTAFYQVGTLLVLMGLLFGVIALTTDAIRSTEELAAERERARIAIDLHDVIGHGLTTLAVQLENADRLRERDWSKSSDYVQRAKATVASLLADVRETVLLLRTGSLVYERPSDSFERLFRDFAASHAITATWEVALVSSNSDLALVACYRIAQEALTNIARHSAATTFHAMISESSNEISLRIEDDGCGFSATARTGTGLSSMRERALALGGTLAIETRDGSGTVIQVCIHRAQRT